MKNKYFNFALATILGFCILLWQSEFVGADNRSARVNFIKGEVYKLQGNDWIRIHQIGVELKENDSVKTGDNSKVEIRFDDGSLMQLASNSTVQLKEYKLNSQGRQSNIKLDKGSIFANVNKLKSKSSFEVTTRSAVAGVRGTEFYVGIDDQEAMTVEVYRGAVAVAAAGKVDEKVVVDEGYETKVNKDQSPNKPKQIKNPRKIEWETK